MMSKASVAVLVAALCLSAAVATCDARVVRFVVEQTRPFAGGMPFGDVGPYERLDGTAYMAVDPNDPHDNLIVDLDKAPRNAQGLVEFSSPFFILKPVDMAK